jgi:hypothetical protein
MLYLRKEVFEAFSLPGTRQIKKTTGFQQPEVPALPAPTAPTALPAKVHRFRISWLLFCTTTRQFLLPRKISTRPRSPKEDSVTTYTSLRRLVKINAI